MPRPRARLDPAALTRAFAPNGLHGATSTAIARCAGVAKPTVYAHAGSKDGAFLACVEAEVERLLSELADADLHTRTLAPRTRIAALAEAIIEHGRADPAAARLLYRTAYHANSTVAAEIELALARLPARIASILRRNTTAACAEQLAAALLGAAATLSLRGGADPEREAIMLGEAFAAVLERTDSADGPASDRVQSVGVY